MAIEAPPRIDVATFASIPREIPYSDDRETCLVWRRMSFSNYQRLPQKPKAEYFDGWAVIHVDAALLPHSWLTRQLFRVLDEALPKLEVFPETGFRVGQKEFVPDVAAFDPGDLERDIVAKGPVLAVEVLSPSTRRYDLVTKMAKYLEVGIGQYWTVDPKREEIIIRENAGDRWRELAVVDAEHPTATIAIGKYGSVTLDHATIFAARRPTAAPTPLPRG